MTGRHDLLVCFNGGVLGGAGDPQFTAPPNATANPPGQVRGGPISSSDYVYLSIAWATYTDAQLTNFLDVQNGTITVHQGSPTGPVVRTVSWATGNSDYWTAPYRFPRPPAATGPAEWSASRLYAPIGQLPSGTYYVDADLQLTRTSFDGMETYKRGAWFGTSGCQMQVG